MKTLKILLALTFIVPILSCNGQQDKKVTPSSSLASSIEASTKENLETLYPNQVKQGFITFQSVNLDDATNKPLAEKLGVSGQTLLLVRGDQKINLTNDGFMYAVVKPEKFKEIINEKIDGLLIK
jgi:negative regulator of sigma E activity